jgi:hypothetical protein
LKDNKPNMALPSDAVAEDYKYALDDLTQNSRIEISNLTVIAKEHIAHAQTISRVIENHIKSVGNLIPTSYFTTFLSQIIR